MVVRRLPTKCSIRTIHIIECCRLSDVITITDNNYVCHSSRIWHSHNQLKSLFNNLVIYMALAQKHYSFF